MSEQFISTKNRINWSLVIFLALTTCTINVLAQNNNEWVAAEITRNLPGQEDISGKTYFSKKFSFKEGTFSAIYQSFFDNRDKVSGKFLVGRFRYVYDEPIGEKGSEFFPLHDESITTTMLDCENNFFGTIQLVFLLNGKKVLENITSDEELLMFQSNISNTTIGDLCAFAKNQGAW